MNVLVSQPEPYINLALEKAAVDLFLRRRKGNLDPFYYSTPLYPGDMVRGAEIWAEFIQKNPDYKVLTEEAALIKRAIPRLRELHGIYDQLIEFGPGSIEAFNSKTRILLDRLKVKIYRPIDLCDDFLSNIESVLRQTNPSIEVQAEHEDFLAKSLKPAQKPSWLSWVGLGFENIPTDSADSMPDKGVRERLVHMRDTLAGGGHCLITLDTNHSHNALMQAYNHPLVTKFTLNLLHQINRDCPNIYIDAEAWSYRPEWHPKKHLVEHHIVALYDQDIEISGKPIRVKKDESFVTEHSFKLPTSYVKKIAESVGWGGALTFGRKGHVQMLHLSI